MSFRVHLVLFRQSRLESSLEHPCHPNARTRLYSVKSLLPSSRRPEAPFTPHPTRESEFLGLRGSSYRLTWADNRRPRSQRSPHVPGSFHLAYRCGYYPCARVLTCPPWSGQPAHRSKAILLLYYSWAKASRSCFSCSSGRLVEMISKLYCLSSSMTLSGAVAPLVKANRAEVPGVTFSRTCLMKSSSIPTSAIEPVSAPIPAPIAAPRKGTKKISPNRKPQKAPPRAPAPAVPCSWRVVGFLLPCGQLSTAASSRVIIWRSCRPSRAMSTLSAPPGSLNFSTESVAIRYSLSFALDRTTPVSIASSRSTSVAAAAVRDSPSLLQIRLTILARTS